MEKKLLTVATLAWNQLELTEKFVASIKKNTTVPYELIMVDNGSCDGTQEYIKEQADKYHLFSKNTGFAHGFNKAISMAEGEFIAICNNDTEFPKNWFEKLSQTFAKDPKCGLVYPCYTSGGKIALRFWPGWRVKKLRKFNKEMPSGVAILSKLAIFRDELGGFSGDFEIAGGEDFDLCFKAWAADYNIYIDERVLVKHKGKGTSRQLPNWRELYKKNGDLFQEKWKDFLKKR